MTIKLKDLRVSERESRDRLAFWATFTVEGPEAATDAGHVSQNGQDDCRVSFHDTLTQVRVTRWIEDLPPFEGDDIQITMTVPFYFELLAHKTHDWDRKGQLGEQPLIRQRHDYYY